MGEGTIDCGEAKMQLFTIYVDSVSGVYVCSELNMTKRLLTLTHNSLRQESTATLNRRTW